MTKLKRIFSSSFLNISLLAVSTLLLSIYYFTVNSLTEINDDKLSANIKTSYRYFVDKPSEYSIHDYGKFANKLVASAPSDIPFELSDYTYWVQITLKSSAYLDTDLVLYADNNLLDVFEIYHINKQDEFSSIPLAGNHRMARLYPHIRVELKSGQEQTYLLKIQTQGPPNVPLIIMSEDNFAKHMLYAQVVYGAFIGIVLLMSLYNFVLYFAIKDKVYLIYIGYLVSAFLILSSLTGFGYLIFPQDIQNTINRHLLFLDYYLVIFLLLFTLFFLRFDTQKNKSYKLGLLLSLVLLIVSFASLQLSFIEQTKLFFSIQPFFYIFALFLIARRLRSDFSWAKYYVLSWCPLLIGAAIQPLVLLNYLDYSFVTRNAFLFAIMLEITLMAFALAERMRRNEKERLTHIAYHISSGLPRKSNLESKINELCMLGGKDFNVIVIKPEHIEQVILYIDDEENTNLFRRLSKKLSALFEYNDAILPLTEKGEKIAFVNNNSFAIILDNDQNQQKLDTLIDSIQKIVLDNFRVKDIDLPLTALVGVASYPDHGNKSHQLINHAMMALPQAELSSNKWGMYTSSSSDQANYLLKLTSDLKAALANNQLAIYHQPQIDLKTQRVCSSECLIRWVHPEEGFIPPNVFIPLAEDLGLINQLTYWVIRQSLTQQYHLINELGFNHMVSINISGKDISSKAFLPNVLPIIEEANVPAEKIIFELTESASLTDNEHAMYVIEQLTELGITISIDDFGTGYSSMSQISHLPFQELKVDREFVENINHDPKRLIIAESTVKMAKGLGLEVVAEGINSEEDEHTLRQFGCDIGQGYHYAKPMSFEDYQVWLDQLVNGRIPSPVEGTFIPANKKSEA